MARVANKNPKNVVSTTLGITPGSSREEIGLSVPNSRTTVAVTTDNRLESISREARKLDKQHVAIPMEGHERAPRLPSAGTSPMSNLEMIRAQRSRDMQLQEQAQLRGYMGRWMPTLAGVQAALQNSFNLGTLTLTTFGIGQKLGAMFNSWMTGSFSTGGLAASTDANGTFPQVDVGKALSSDLSSTLLGGLAAGPAGALAQVVIAPVVAATLLPNKTYKPVNPAVFYPDPDPRGLSREQYKEQMQAVQAKRDEVAKRQASYNLANSKLGGMISFGLPYGLVGALNGPLSGNKLASGTQYLVAAGASWAGGLGTGAILAGQKAYACHVDEATGEKYPLFMPADINVRKAGGGLMKRLLGYIPQDVAKNIQSAAGQFNDGRTGWDMAGHILDQTRKRALGVTEATLPGPFLNAVANVFRNKASNSPAGQSVLGMLAGAAAICCAVGFWFSTLPRIQAGQKKPELSNRDIQVYTQQAENELKLVSAACRDCLDSLGHLPEAERGDALLMQYASLDTLKTGLEQLKKFFDQKPSAPGPFRGRVQKALNTVHRLIDELEQASNSYLATTASAAPAVMLGGLTPRLRSATVASSVHIPEDDTGARLQGAENAVVLTMDHPEVDDVGATIPEDRQESTIVLPDLPSHAPNQERITYF